MLRGRRVLSKASNCEVYDDMHFRRVQLAILHCDVEQYASAVPKMNWQHRLGLWIGNVHAEEFRKKRSCAAKQLPGRVVVNFNYPVHPKCAPVLAGEAPCVNIDEVAVSQSLTASYRACRWRAGGVPVENAN